MIFRQLFDSVSGTYSYILASRAGGEALILDPVLEKVDRYCQLLRELDLRLVKAVDTHLHADHVTGLGELRDRTHCVTIMGEQSKADVVAMRVADGDQVTIEGLSLQVMYTPGHTDDSYSYLMGDRVFTGDTLLIRGTGRTDFQNGSARAQYESIFGRLLKLPDETMVFPAHDYKGDTVSTIGEERRFNPRLQVRSIDEYVELMGNLKLPNPKMMDVAVPANMHVGLHQDELARQGQALGAREAIESLGRPDVLLVDLRETSERAKHGTLSGALHAPYPESAKACDRAACCAKWRRRPGAGSYFSARSANARRWPWPPPGKPASPIRRTSPAASTRGKRPAARCWPPDGRGSARSRDGDAAERRRHTPRFGLAAASWRGDLASFTTMADSALNRPFAGVLGLKKPPCPC